MVKAAAASTPLVYDALLNTDEYQPMREAPGSGVRPYVEQAYGGDWRGRDGGCFTEMRPVEEGAGRVPFVYEFDTLGRRQGFAKVWFTHASRVDRVDYLYLLGGCYEVAGGALGMSDDMATNHSVVYVQRIEDYCQQYPLHDPARWNECTTIHETGHVFNIGMSDSDFNHLDIPNHMGNDDCQMAYTKNKDDDITEFCRADTDHLSHIRTENPD